MADLAETVFLDHDNPIVLKLTRNGSAADLNDVTGITIDCGSLEITSADNPDAVAWGGDSVTLKLGTVAGLADLGTKVTARVIVFTPATPNGLVWVEKLKLTLKPPI